MKPYLNQMNEWEILFYVWKSLLKIHYIMKKLKDVINYKDDNIKYSKELKFIYKIIKLQNKFYSQLINIIQKYQNLIFQLDKLECKIKNYINNIKNYLIFI